MTSLAKRADIAPVDSVAWPKLDAAVPGLIAFPKGDDCLRSTEEATPIGLAIDKYIESENLRGVAFIGLALLGLAVAGWLAQWVQQVMTAFMGHRILLTLRTQMFNHIQKLPCIPGIPMYSSCEPRSR